MRLVSFIYHSTSAQPRYFRNLNFKWVVISCVVVCEIEGMREWHLDVLLSIRRNVIVYLFYRRRRLRDRISTQFVHAPNGQSEDQLELEKE